MRRTSVSLPTNKVAHDPYEKRARYEANHKEAGILEKFTDLMSQARQARWFKTIAVLVVVLFLFFYLSPSGVDIYSGVSSSSTPVSGQTPADGSYGTQKCTRSSSRDKPIVQYVLMIDAGSTGSRIHVYKFNNCGPTPELEGEVFKQTEKREGGSGLSAYPDDPEAAAKSLDVLLAAAMEAVPDKLKGCTPIAVKATAGLRLLGKEKSEKILAAVRTHLERDYPFPVVADESGVSIMDGKDEAIYAWITVNYLLGKIGGPDHSETAAVFDLGGGSTQIVFEPTFKGAPHGGMPEKMADGDHKYSLDFGGRKFSLYQHSHLGYGLMSARESIFKTLIDDIWSQRKDDTKWLKAPIVNPCFAAGMNKTIEVKMGANHPLGEKVEVNMRGPNVGSAAQCRTIAEKILNKGADCNLSPCSFNGVHQPSIAKTFAREDVFFLSYFTDRAEALGMPESFTLREMHDLAKVVCDGGDSWGVFEGVKGALEELEGRPEYCLDLNFMMALVHTGYEMPIDREVRVAKKIKDNELGWCLGASLPLLAKGSGWSCKISEIQ